MIDTHSHIFLDTFKQDIQQVLSRAVENGLSHIFMPAIDFDSIASMNRIEHTELQLHQMAGIHPTQVDESKAKIGDRLHTYCDSPSIVAVGETGLDYYWSTKHKKLQKKLLRTHCEVAKATGKPVVLHNRSSTSDLLDIIEEQQEGSLTGVWHCFNGSVEEGKRALDLGLYLGIGGLVTFSNASVDESVRRLPVDKMVLETDAPYLAPEPHRGDRNEPAFVIHTGRKMAEIFDLPLEEVERITDQNALELFRLSE